MNTRLNLKDIRGFIERDQFLVSKHARIRMFQRNVSTDEIKDVVLNGDIIEEYLTDKPCPSVLILGFSGGSPYHVVIAQCEDHVRIITVYKPETDKWIDYRVRRN